MNTESELTELRQHASDRMEGRTKWLRREAWLWRLGFLVAAALVGYLAMLETGYRAAPDTQGGEVRHRRRPSDRGFRPDGQDPDRAERSR